MSYDLCQEQLVALNNTCKMLVKSGNAGIPLDYDLSKDIINLVPDSWFSCKSYMNGNSFDRDAYTETHRVIDISCNSGVLLEHFYHKFMHELSRAISDSFEREDYILKNLLYAFCLDVRLIRLLRMRFYWSYKCRGHIYQYNVTNNSGIDYKHARSILESMRFDVVCGNPPYNDGLYSKFVNLGYDLSSNYCLWITPDSWRFNDKGKDIKEFQNTIVPKMIKIVSCNSQDVFEDISPFTITYYLIGKSDVNDKLVNNLLFKDFNRLQSFDKSCKDITNKVRQHKDFKSIIDKNSIFIPRNFCRTSIPDFGDKNFDSDVIDENSPITMTATNNVYHVKKSCIKKGMLKDIDKYSLYTTAWVQPSFVYHINEPYNIEYGKNLTLFLGTEDECKSAASYFKCSLIWYLVYGNFGTRAIHTRCFTFVPDPCSFNKIYEDRPLDGYKPDKNGEYKDKYGKVHCSLYVKYGLTDEEIKTIESVVCKRK